MYIYLLPRGTLSIRMEFVVLKTFSNPSTKHSEDVQITTTKLVAVGPKIRYKWSYRFPSKYGEITPVKPIYFAVIYIGYSITP